MDEKEIRGQRLNEYQEFCQASEIAPPGTVSEKILKSVQTQLNPPIWRILAKLSVIYAVVGFLVLLFCPQFGVTVLAEIGMLKWFALLGTYGCMLACGGFFLGAGSLVAGLLLRPEELKRARPLRWFYFLGYGVMALLVFLMVGGEIMLSMGAIWLIGALMGETIAFELTWKLRALPLARRA